MGINLAMQRLQARLQSCLEAGVCFICTKPCGEGRSTLLHGQLGEVPVCARCKESYSAPVESDSD